MRDLHDGAQQRPVHTVVTLKLARDQLGAGDWAARELVEEALEQAERATDGLRELAHGILPAVLVRGGLRAGVEALASRMTLPVAVDVPAVRLPAAVEATAYFEVRDDGIGGAVPGGRGLLELTGRRCACRSARRGPCDAQSSSDRCLASGRSP